MKATNRFGLLLLLITSLTVLSSAAQEVSVANGTGYGTTGIYARTFGTAIRKMGTAIVYVPDAVKGDSFVIKNSGIYAVSYTDGGVSSDDIGISVNLPATTNFSTSWGTARELCAFEVSNTAESCGATVQLSKGDVLRAHSTFGGHPPNSQSVARFIVTKIQ
jgi:hypothetical protein